MDSPPPKPPPQKSPFQVLPRRSELSSQNIQFLDQDIVTHQDLLTRAPLLLSDLTKECSNFDSYLLNLRRKLTKLAVSWISRSFSAKSSLSNVNFLLENLSLQTSQYGIGSWKVGKVLVEEIPKLVKQVQRIENIRKYIDTALQLEALVGDLEDGVFCVSGLHARNLFSEKLRTSLKSIDFGPKQERILEAIKTMNNIEEVLVYIEKFQAQWHHLLESVDARVDKILVECDVMGTESKHFVLSTRGDHKAPLVAESALKIAWEMIERSQTLPSLQPRIRFIRSTAARFFWYFLNGLILRCKNTDFSLENVDASIIKVCGSINAARYIESKMQEWSDDVSFLEMRIAEKDSDIDRNNEVLGNSCFFGEEIKSLEELMTNWLMEIISALLHHFETLSWEYLQNGRYFVQENLHRVPAVTDLAVSFDIVQALDALKSQLHLLKMSLNPKDFLDLWRSVADALDQFVSRSIFTSGIRYSSGGINQFDSDMQALFHVFQPFCYRPDAFFPCIREILKLLQMSKEEAKLLQVALFKDKNGTKCLHSLGISHLTFDQVDNVLSNRKCRS
ncbi:hypothetical protein OIU76_014629 [Salix suchowensis]|nr:hypothetical protein OIU76_014629 [Salix suchowensis]